jgi:trehalose 6-phosphate phosphatase
VLAEPARAVVAIDYDGTLAPIVSRPADALPAPGAVAAVAALASVVGICAVVSGRAAEDVVDLAGLAAVPGVRVLGHYGLESWIGGRLDSPPADPGVAAARPLVAELVAAAPDGVHVEDKGHSVVVHTRPAADPAAALVRLAEPLRRIAGACGLEVVPGRFVLELRPPGVDKGLAVRRLADGWGPVVYVGDDVGDLPAFAVVEERRSAGMPGLTVASADDADAPPELALRADLVLPGPSAVVAFLRALAAAIGSA